LNACQLPRAKSTHHQELIFTTFDFNIIGSTQSCQGVHQDWLAWCIQLDVYLKKMTHGRLHSIHAMAILSML
jgi:hypothetical protein